MDLSARQVASGQAMVAELGLTNLELRHASIADVDAGFGLFDYIICHGVFSWVDAALQDKILAVCRANLSENGVAYVSYNIFPGWHDKLKVREMLVHQMRGVTDPQARIRKSREFLNLMAELVAPEGSEPGVYGARLRSEAELVNAQDDDYICHEYLEDVNAPLYFYVFAERAERHGLQYLADADRGLRSLDSLPAPVLAAMRQHADGIVAQEQLLDYYTNHTFRSTLLGPAGRHIDRSVTPARLRRLFVRSPLEAVLATPDITGVGIETFGAADLESTYATVHPVTKAAMFELHDAYPRAVAFDDLIARACARVYAEGDLARSPVILTREAEVVGVNLLQGHTADSNLIDLHAHAPALAPAADPGQRPAARYKALRSRSVTNAYHRPVRLGTLSWYLLPFLDGTRDLAELVDPDVKRPLLRAEVSSSLTGLARAALIMASVNKSIGQQVNWSTRQ